MDYLGIVSQLDRMEGMMRRLMEREADPSVDLEGAMRLTGATSKTALHRMFRRLGVAPFTRGKYRRADIMNAMKRASHTRSEKLMQQHRLDAESEKLSESQRKQPRPNPQDD